MRKIKPYILAVCLCGTLVAGAQHRKINMEQIRQQPYMALAARINCNAGQGSMLEDRICANLRLQREDSLLQVELNRQLAVAHGDAVMIKKLKQAQELWEYYRFAHCDTEVTDKGSAQQMTAFMDCAADLTRQRREVLHGSEDSDSGEKTD